MPKSYYPINLDVSGKKCLVVGGGKVAQRKIKTLLNFGARVVAVAPRFTAGISRLSGKVKLIPRKYKSGDLTHAALAIVATDDPVVNRKISADARRSGVLVNVIDQPALCSFIAPSVIKRGPLVVSISTSGQSPAFAKALRLKLERLISPKMGKLVNALGKVRAATRFAQRRQRLGTASPGA
jgi:precorrin-2 dehydrogenase/sirohydrochlorin ferrochelatase